MLYFYFDTSLKKEEAQLLQSNIRLRVRIKEQKCSFELRNYQADTYQNFLQEISWAEFNFFLQGELPKGVVKEELLAIGLEAPLILIGSSQTVRAKKPFYGGKLIIDKTTNLNQDSWQIEFRSEQKFSSYMIGKIKRELGISGRCCFVRKLKRIWML
jgi:uncharacterized protein YjbK